MNKADFLINLKRSLKKNLSKEEAEEIIRDYNEYFETGMADGKTEEELICEFGSPDMIAKELMMDKPLSRKQNESIIKFPYLNIRISLKAILAVLFLLILFYYASLRHNPLSFFADEVFAVIIPLSLVFFIYKHKCKFQVRLFTRINYPVYIIILTLLSVLIAILIGFMIYIRVYLNENMNNLMNTPQIESLISHSLGYMMNSLYILIPATFIWIVLMTNQRIRSVSFLFYPFGAFLSSLLLRDQFTTMSGDVFSRERLSDVIFKSLFPIAFGMFLSVISYVIIRNIKRMKRAGL
jgi:uncharacterized membrane protein